MKLNKKDSLAITRSYLSMIFYQKVCNYHFNYGMVLPYTSAHKHHGKRSPAMDPDFYTDDLMEFLDLQRHRCKGTFVAFTQDEIMLRDDYMSNISGFHIFLSLSYFDLTNSAAEKTISFIGNSPDDSNIVDFVKFAINSTYKFLPKDKELSLLLDNKDLQLVWKEVHSQYSYFYKIISRTKYYV